MFAQFIRKIRLKMSHPTVRCAKSATLINTSLGLYTQVTANASVVNSSLGDYTSVGRNTTVQNATIGKFCSISWNATIGATSHPYTHISTHAFPYVKDFGFVSETHKIKVPTEIGNDVWIGANAIIMPGLKIGHGAIIGAGSVVTKDVPAYGIVAGNPAKILKMRFSEEEITQLLKLEWWNWETAKIKKHIESFKKPLDIDALVKNLEA